MATILLDKNKELFSIKGTLSPIHKIRLSDVEHELQYRKGEVTRFPKELLAAKARVIELEALKKDMVKLLK